MLSERAKVYLQDVSHKGEMPDATHYGVAGEPGGGPYFEIWLLVEDGVVQRASYMSMGCPTSKAVGSAICNTAEGRPLSVLAELDSSTLTTLIGGVPDGKGHIPVLATGALMNITEIKNTKD